MSAAVFIDMRLSTVRNFGHVPSDYSAAIYPEVEHLFLTDGQGYAHIRGVIPSAVPASTSVPVVASSTPAPLNIYLATHFG